MVNAEDNLPDSIIKWPSETSWVKNFAKYIVENNKFVVYPYAALSTNIADAGVNIKNTENYLFQSFLSASIPKRFDALSDSSVKYDMFFEIYPECIKMRNKKLQNYDFDVDLYGQKQRRHLKHDLLFSSRECSSPVLSVPLVLKPIEQNLILGEYFNNRVENKLSISLGKAEAFNVKKPALDMYFMPPVHKKYLLQIFLRKIMTKL